MSRSDEKSRIGPPVALARKLLAAQAAVQTVRQRGRNQGQGYNYAMEADVLREARRVLHAHNVLATVIQADPNTSEIQGDKRTLQVRRVALRITFTDVDSGEEWTTSAFGEGSDTGDKGLYKAVTGAFKQGLAKNLQIPTGDDPEKDTKDSAPQKTSGKHAPLKAPEAVKTETQKPASVVVAEKAAEPETQKSATAVVTENSLITKEQKKAFWAAARDFGHHPIPEVSAWLRTFGIEKSDEIKVGNYSALLTRVSNPEPLPYDAVPSEV